MDDATDRPKLGVIGLGNMGSALADVLTAAGFDVIVWNRTHAKSERFAKAGVKVAVTVAEAARAADVLVVCLLDQAATQAAIEDPGVIEVLHGKTIIQLTTMTSTGSREFGAWAAENGIAYLEGQILHYPDDVRAGRAFIPCAGPKRVYESCRAILEAMACEAPLVSESFGAAAVFDKSLFEVLFPAYIGFLHGASMCRASGVSVETYTDLMAKACFASGLAERTVREFGARAAVGRYDDNVKAALDTYAPAFAMTVHESDAAGIRTDHIRGIDAILRGMVAAGHSHEDFAAIYELFRPMAVTVADRRT